MKRVGVLCGKLVLLLLITLLMAEGILQCASLFVSGRAGELRPGAARHILCVGDSHTFGAFVGEAASYPGQLQAFLDEQASGVYSVINLGVPGINTAQVLNRLPENVSRYHPDTLIVWCGSNDAWNGAEVYSESSNWRLRLEGVASHLRLYRLVRVWLYERQLERDTTDASERDGRRQQADMDPKWASTTIRHDGIIERLQHEWIFRPSAEVEEGAERDYRAMAEYARAAGIRLVLVSYPQETGAFAAANQAMRRVATDYGLTLVESGKSLERVPVKQRNFLWGYHPNGPMYREIARDVAAAVSTGEVSRSRRD